MTVMLFDELNTNNNNKYFRFGGRHIGFPISGMVERSRKQGVASEIFFLSGLGAEI